MEIQELQVAQDHLVKLVQRVAKEIWVMQGILGAQDKKEMMGR